MFADRNKNWTYKELSRRFNEISEKEKEAVADYPDYSMHISCKIPFVVFQHHALDKEDAHDIQYNNWKVHLSIDTQDLSAAWNIIFPILAKENCEFFKITILSEAFSAVENYPKEVGIVNRGKKGKGFKIGVSAGGDLNEAEKDEFESSYIQAALRIGEGLQITIYPFPGKEEKIRCALQEIENSLIAENIRPGKFDAIDSRIGAYSSIRHTGFSRGGYIASSQAASFNPDNADEVFYHVDQGNIIFKLKSAVAAGEPKKNVINGLLSNIKNVDNLLVLYDLIKFVNSPAFRKYSKEKQSQRIFKSKNKVLSMVIKSIKQQAINIAMTKGKVSNVEDQAMHAILSLKRNRLDARSPRTLEDYLKLQEAGKIIASKPQGPSHRK